MPSGPTPDTIKNKGALPLKPQKPRLEWGTQLWARMNSESLGGHLAQETLVPFEAPITWGR